MTASTSGRRARLGGLLLAGALAAVGWQPVAAQTAVAVGSGSYASAIPAAENVNTDGRTVYVLPGNTEPIPTNDWWTPLILQNMYGSTQYHLWAHPLDFSVDGTGLNVHFPTEWSGGTDINKQMVIPAPVKVGGAGFVPNAEKVKSWGDWTVAFRLSESATEYVDVTIGHGLPYTWLEYTGVTTGQVTTDATTSYRNAAGATQTFPFTGSSYAFTWQGRNYAVFAPASTTFSLTGGVVSAAFSGSARYLVVAAMPNTTSFATFAQYAYAVPRNSTVSWAYNETAGQLTTTWNVTTAALQGTNTNVLQGFLPHQLKYTTLNFATNGLNYLSARGTVQLAAGNNFQITYKYNGALSHLPAPEVLSGKPNGYNATQMANYISTFLNSPLYLGETNTYGSGKSLTQFARFATYATVLGNSNAAALKNKLKTGLINWLTYTPGEAHTYFANMPNFKALMGFDTGFGSEEFNDHHFHYGYHVYAAGVLGLDDPTFISQYGEMAKLVTKEYANWDRTDKRFPFMRTFDPWEGHSWANGGYGMNPPIGNNQESTSEAMMSWAGMIQLGLATGDAAMTNAGVFGYVTEAAATNEYWFDRDDQNFPASYGPAGKIGCIVGGANMEYQTFFGLNPIYVHAIQYIPVLPSSYYLVQNDKFAQAQTEYDYLVNKSVTGGYGNIGSWGDEWNNLALQYTSMFNPEYAAANQSALGTNAGEAGMTYYTLHSNRALGRRRFDYYIGATNSGVFYNSELNQYTYCAFNPTSTAKTYTVYQNTTAMGTITVPARTFFSSHTLGGGTNTPPTVSVTAPANGATFTAPATINITANAADANGTVTQVQFYNGSTLLGTDTSSPYAFSWTGVAAGTYSITARATDNGGATTTSSAVSVTVNAASNTPPTVSLTAPANGATFTAPATISITANAADANGTVTQVQFYNGATLLGTDTSSPYAYSWTGVAAGTYSITARATDNGGAVTTSAAVSVTVNAAGSPNLALNRPVTVSSTETAQTPGSAAVDGNPSTTRWSSAFADPQWIYVDLGASYSVSRVKLTWEAAYGANYLIQTSTDASNWTTLRTVTGNTALVNDQTGLSGAAGRYVRIYGTVRGTPYGYSLYELEVYGTASGGGACTGTVANGDYSYQVSTTNGTVTWTFIPLGPIAGSTMALLYVQSAPGGGYPGYQMTASGSNFTYSLPFAAGTSLSFYFTYRVGATMAERNSSATPHTYIVGTACRGTRPDTGSPKLTLADLQLYPNPSSRWLDVELPDALGGELTVRNLLGATVLTRRLAADDRRTRLDVAALRPGVYTLTVRTAAGTATQRFEKE